MIDQMRLENQTLAAELASERQNTSSLSNNREITIARLETTISSNKGNG